MIAQTDTSRRDDLIARNLAAVETHFHNETPETIDAAIAVYTDDIVWEVPARAPGTTVSVRLLHAFQCRDGKIFREHGYEIWRDINDHARVQDDIPATATVQEFG